MIEIVTILTNHAISLIFIALVFIIRIKKLEIKEKRDKQFFDYKIIREKEKTKRKKQAQFQLKQIVDNKVLKSKNRN